MTRTHKLGLWINHQMLPCALGLLACGISLILTMQYCRVLRGDMPGMLPEAVGLVWEIGKYMFVTAGFALCASTRHFHKLSGLVFLSIATVLIVGSVRASIHWLSENDEHNHRERTEQSENYQAITQEIQNLDAEYQMVIHHAQQDQATHMRTRSIESMNKAQALRERRSGLVQQRAEMGSVPQSASSRLGTNTEYVVVSVMLEIISVAAFALFRLRVPGVQTAASTGTKPSTNTSTSTGTNTSTSTSTKPSTSTGTNTSTSTGTKPSTSTGTKPSTSTGTKPGTKYGKSTKPAVPVPVLVPGGDTYHHAKALIASGEIVPGYRELKTKLRLGQQTVTTLMGRLAQDGIIVRAGRSWAVAS